MDWHALARAVVAPVTAGAAPYQSALLRPPEQKLGYIAGYEAAPTQRMLVHGPGATELLAGVGGQGDGNSAVYACLAALAAAYIEAPLRVYRRLGPGRREEVASGSGADLARLLQTPNPAMTGLEVWHWVQWAKHIDGNAYLRKLRAGNRRTGNVVELWPMSPCRVEIRASGPDFITAYRWHFAAGQYVDLPPENVVHFRLGLDDRDHRKGLAPLKRLVRALTTDAAAEAWAASLLLNGAVPGAVIQTKATLTVEQAEELKQKWEARFGGDQRGRVGVLDNEATASQFGFSPEQMVFEALSKQPETRIAGVLRVPAIVAGLGVGLDQATYSNARTLTEFFTERTMVPLWQMDAAKLQSQLVPDFTSDPAIVVAHDLTDVRALQEDEDSKYKRLDTAVAGGWVTINEARSDVGLPEIDGGAVRRVPTTVTEVAVGEAAPVPAPAPTPLRAVAGRKAAEAPITAADEAAALTFWREAVDGALADLLDAEPVPTNGVAH